ncbi:squalene epoxidase-domain-containing protein [Xylariales sp. PMI_506]|nr:squalene epoxidase-domain-containing protein [Xylariales sp. PMI_506]
MTTPANPDPRRDRREKYHEADVVVVGAGVFGCAVAYALAEQNRSVLLLERWLREPDRIVGELLQAGGVDALKKIGLGHTLEGIDAVPCYGYDVIFYGTEVLIPYPKVDSDGKVVVDIDGNVEANRLHDAKANGHANGHTNGSTNGKARSSNGKRPEGRSFHHGRFIQQLRNACQGHPNITLVEAEAVAPVRGDNTDEVLGVEARVIDPNTGSKVPDAFFGQLTIVADGYASIFRKQYLPGSVPIVRSKFYALELIDCELPHTGFGHVIIGAASPVLLYQIGTHETRALINVPEGCPEAAPAAGGVRGYITNVVLPTLPESIQPSFRAALDRDNKIPRSMPNSWLPPVKQSHKGIVILGDALNMRHPLTGGGMTVAFNDVIILKDLLSPSNIPNLGDNRAVAKAMNTFYWRRKSLTAIINVLAMALYALFNGADPNLAKLRRGCFAYFEKGYIDEPVGMLGGLIHDPTVLARHFFTVAFLAIWIDAKETGLWKLPVVIWNAISILWTACVVFVPVMWKEAK